MGVRIWHVAIPVNDLEKAVLFYSRFLGFNVMGYDEYESKKQAFISVEQDGFCIELFEPKQDKNKRIAAKPDHLAFEVDDLIKYRDELAKRSGDSLPDIQEFENGVKYLGLRDPDGMSIEVFQGRKIYDEFLASQPAEL